MAADATPSSHRYRPTRGHRDFRFARTAPPTARRSSIPGTAPAAADKPPQAAKAPSKQVVLDVQRLKTYFFTYDGVVRAIDGIDLQARAGETTGVVGETGCGKSVTAFSIARLIAEPGQVISGKVMLNGANVLWGLENEAKYRRVKNSNRIRVIRRFRRVRAATERMSAVRGRGVAMIFQEPSQAMNPVFSITDQLGESLLLHEGVEIYETLLRADKRAATAGIPAQGGSHEALTEESATVDSDPAALAATADFAPLVQAAAARNQDAMRAAARAIAESYSLPSLATELFYLVKDAGPTAPSRLGRLQRTVARSHLTGFRRAYLRHRRRVALLERAIKDVYLKEMKMERSQVGARGRLRLRLIAEQYRHFYYRIPIVKRRLEKPIKTEVFWRTVQLLEGVRIANPVQVARGYPHELSGGMLQRVMIAMALSSEPKLLLADEPTTALDVTIQAQILDLMRQLRERVGTAIVLITHDLGVVAEVCDRVNVMYAGLVVESAPVLELFRRPLHPYTQGLLASIPRFDQPDKELASIPGSVPNLIHPPPGCRFHPRCPYAMPICREVRPPPTIQGPEHMVACHLYTEPDTDLPAEARSMASELPRTKVAGTSGGAAPALVATLP